MEGPYKPLVTSDTKVKVSSTLDKTVGKKNLTDGNPETCWTSQQGLPQIIHLVFPEPVRPMRLILTFQGGFVGTQCAIDVAASASEPVWTTLTHIHPEDVNRRQVFQLPEGNSPGIQCMKFVMERSSDFFGRITLYELQVEGWTP
ncbi:galactose-binding domain-like protein [Pisolithus orientalis]|uniref:galactose-binding domain-like protein n=1 Tax=Pisolithus orientalis TaxID=936130 RepID=UPI00222552E3|nr:galactose-binding domain-like protein [Pisolithus orientalis]KAI6012604.1 galactose-binding domain-like protein [Pisolithus orientalis]